MLRARSRPAATRRGPHLRAAVRGHRAAGVLQERRSRRCAQFSGDDSIEWPAARSSSRDAGRSALRWSPASCSPWFAWWWIVPAPPSTLDAAIPTATSCWSRSTPCARTRSARTAGAPRRRISIGWPRSGARFTFAHAHAVVTLPSHASILSGRYPYEHGIRDNTGYRFPDDAANGGDAAQGGRLRDRRVRRRIPARPAIRPGHRLRRLRRSSSARGDGRDRTRRARAPRRRGRDVGARSGSTQQAANGSRGCTSTIRTCRTSRRAEWAARFPSDPYLGEVSCDRCGARRAVRSAGDSARAPRSSSSRPITARASAITAS